MKRELNGEGLKAGKSQIKKEGLTACVDFFFKRVKRFGEF